MEINNYIKIKNLTVGHIKKFTIIKKIFLAFKIKNNYLKINKKQSKMFCLLLSIFAYYDIFESYFKIEIFL